MRVSSTHNTVPTTVTSRLKELFRVFPLCGRRNPGVTGKAVGKYEGIIVFRK